MQFRQLGGGGTIQRDEEPRRQRSLNRLRGDVCLGPGLRREFEADCLSASQPPRLVDTIGVGDHHLKTERCGIDRTLRPDYLKGDWRKSREAGEGG